MNWVDRYLTASVGDAAISAAKRIGPLAVVAVAVWAVGADWALVSAHLRRLPTPSPWWGVGGLAVVVAALAGWARRQHLALVDRSAQVLAELEGLPGQLQDAVEQGEALIDNAYNPLDDPLIAEIRVLEAHYEVLRRMDLLWCTTDGRFITAANPALCRLLDEEQDKLVGMLVSEYLEAYTSPAEATTTVAYHDRMAETGEGTTRLQLMLGPRQSAPRAAGPNEATDPGVPRRLTTWYSWGDRETHCTYGIGVLGA